MTDELCAKCRHPRAEHSINGACYGLCGEFVAPHPAPDATDWKARCEAAERVLDLIDNQRYAAQVENKELRAALIAAREAILSLRDTLWPEADGTDDEWIGYIDAVLPPPPEK